MKYRNEEFLPQMQEFEAQMSHYIQDPDGVLKPVKPILSPSQKKIIPLFQDESCFMQMNINLGPGLISLSIQCSDYCTASGFERERSCSKVNPVVISFMSPILSMKSVVDWSYGTKMVRLKWMHKRSSTQV